MDNNPMRGEPPRANQGVERALTALTLLAEEASTLARLSARLGVNKSSVLRMLQTMEAQSFVRRDEQQRYHLGSQLFALANRALEDMDLREVAEDALTQLAAACGHTVKLAERQGTDVVYIDKRESRMPVRSYSRVGSRLPLHCTALGKAMLAHRPADEAAALIARCTLQRRTDYTLVTVESLERDLVEVRHRGFAIDERENEDAVRCIAAPVRNARGIAEAAISISVPATTASLEELLMLHPLLVRAANIVSARFGWRPDLGNDITPGGTAVAVHSPRRAPADTPTTTAQALRTETA
ncbi:IclR family transcriptional regulator [Verrucosispora sp. TAA-831]|uniref:IclR family transcriptional regulator n=1 Tax=Verrucosispora sp. TAA-831 TaxID=3422227 RepID=UPI003D700E92